MSNDLKIALSFFVSAYVMIGIFVTCALAA